MSVSGNSRGQERASDSLELELWLVMSYHVGSGNLILLFSQSSKLSQLPLSQLCSLQSTILSKRQIC